jgi:hypothetical protein
MLKTNVIGSVVVCLVLFAILGYLLSLGISINWNFYFKVAAVVLAIAAIIGIASSGGEKS